MYNLLMTFHDDHDLWEANQGRGFAVRFLRGRMLEYTDDAIKQRFAPDGRPDFEALMQLPCLFTYEGTDVIGTIGYITEVRDDNGPFTITYNLPSVYPNILINNETSFTTLGIGPRSSGEMSRTHWAVKNVDLFEATTRLAHNISGAPVILSDAQMRNVWGDDYRRKYLVCLSHNAQHSDLVARVKTQLDTQGICCFLAHEDIAPSTIWQDEIINALNTMDIFIGFVTNDFHSGSWTNQEIGYAVQRDVFRVFVKFGREDPQGMVAREQALNTDWDDAADAIIAHLHKAGKLRPKF